jgi:Homeodomain-like domain
MVAAVRAGASQRAVARQFQVHLRTVQRWVDRAAGQPLDQVEWRDHPAGPRQAPRRSPPPVEALVLTVRQELRATSDLGEYGAAAIHRELVARGLANPPAVRTINRILARHGVFDAPRRVRHRPPPRGWYLPDVAAGQDELDEIDVISGLVIKGGPEVEVLTCIALHSGLSEAWPHPAISAATVRAALLGHWQAWGRPAYAQFDNDTRFQGPHQHPDTIGSVTRLCLQAGVTPVFVPPRETGFQAGIESLNGRWQAKVWARFEHESLAGLQERSARYVAASRQRSAVRREGAPARLPLPADWAPDPATRLRGRIIYLRRTSEAGQVSLLGRSFAVTDHWVHRLVRCEVDLDAACLRIYALRRRAPSEQPLLREVAYTLPQRPARDGGSVT